MKHVILILCAVVLFLPLGPASPKPEPVPDRTQSDLFDEFADNYRALPTRVVECRIWWRAERSLA